MDYNRVGLNQIGVKAGLVNQTPFGSFFGYTATFESIKVDQTEDRYIEENYIVNNPDVFERKYFAGFGRYVSL